MKYEAPSTAPANFNEFQVWMLDELRRLADAMSEPEFDTARLKEWNAEPQKLYDGLLAFADGANWNPGSEKGLHAYYNAQWNPLNPQYKYKKETLIRNNNQTMTTDPDLSGWLLLPDSIYAIDGQFNCDAALSVVPDFKCDFAISQPPIRSNWCAISVTSGSVISAQDNNTTITADYLLPLGAADTHTYMRGMIKTHATLASTLDFRWAQQTATTPADTRVFEGSWIRLSYLGPAS